MSQVLSNTSLKVFFGPKHGEALSLQDFVCGANHPPAPTPAPPSMSVPTLLFMSHDSFKLNTELMKSCFIICDGPLGCLVNIFQFSDVPYKDKPKKKTKVTSTVRAVIKRQGPGISPGYYDCGPWLISKESSRKIEPKETPSCLIPHLLPIVFTHQLELLVTALTVLLLS